MSARIGVVGSNMVDLVTYTARMPEAGETLEAQSFAMGHGGKGANQAVAAAKLGADVLLVSRVGDDLFGGNGRDRLKGGKGTDTCAGGKGRDLIFPSCDLRTRTKRG